MMGQDWVQGTIVGVCVLAAVVFLLRRYLFKKPVANGGGCGSCGSCGSSKKSCR